MPMFFPPRSHAKPVHKPLDLLVASCLEVGRVGYAVLGSGALCRARAM